MATTAVLTAPITALYGALLGAFYLYLCVQVIRQRRSKQIGIGDGGDKQAARVIRVHANFAEYVPLALLLMLVAEVNGGADLLLHVIGATLVVARVLHAQGLGKNDGVTWQRLVGTLATFAVYAVLIVVHLLGFVAS